MSSFLAGAEMMTFLTVPRRCLRASSALVKRPVDSMTISAPTDSQSMRPGLFPRRREIHPFSTLIPFSVAEIS